jgi:hypothetical protein
MALVLLHQGVKASHVGRNGLVDRRLLQHLLLRLVLLVVEEHNFCKQSHKFHRQDFLLERMSLKVSTTASISRFSQSSFPASFTNFPTYRAMAMLWPTFLPLYSKTGSCPNGVAAIRRSLQILCGFGVATFFELGPFFALDADVLEVDVAVLEEETRSFGEASAVEVGQFVSWSHR